MNVGLAKTRSTGTAPQYRTPVGRHSIRSGHNRPSDFRATEPPGRDILHDPALGNPAGRRQADAYGHGYAADPVALGGKDACQNFVAEAGPAVVEVTAGALAQADDAAAPPGGGDQREEQYVEIAESGLSQIGALECPSQCLLGVSSPVAAHYVLAAPQAWQGRHCDEEQAAGFDEPCGFAESSRVVVQMLQESSARSTSNVFEARGTAPISPIT